MDFRYRARPRTASAAHPCSRRTLAGAAGTHCFIQRLDLAIAIAARLALENYQLCQECEAAGRVLLCDSDPTCIGPWQANIVAVPVGEKRFGRAGAHKALVATYGYDVARGPD